MFRGPKFPANGGIELPLSMHVSEEDFGKQGLAERPVMCPLESFQAPLNVSLDQHGTFFSDRDVPADKGQRGKRLMRSHAQSGDLMPVRQSRPDDLVTSVRMVLHSLGSEVLGDGTAEGLVSGVFDEHAPPGEGLQHHPVPAEGQQDGAEADYRAAYLPKSRLARAHGELIVHVANEWYDLLQITP